MTITLQTTTQPLGLEIGLADVPEVTTTEEMDARDLVAEAEAIIAAAEPLIEAARAGIFAQDEAARLKLRIEELERELETERASKATFAPGPSPTPGLASRVASTVRRALTPQLPVRSPRARHVLDTQEPYFLDLETTGRTKRDRIVEVAVIDAQGQVVFSTLVNPGRKIPAEASAVHGIHDRDVADAPTWEQVAQALREILAGRVVVAHYAKFDRKFISDDWGIRWVCTKELADAVFGQAHWTEARANWRRSGKLADRLRQCGLRPGPEHSAAGDCLSTLRLMRFLAGYGEQVNLIY